MGSGLERIHLRRVKDTPRPVVKNSHLLVKVTKGVKTWNMHPPESFQSEARLSTEVKPIPCRGKRFLRLAHSHSLGFTAPRTRRPFHPIWASSPLSHAVLGGVSCPPVLAWVPPSVLEVGLCDLLAGVLAP